jgi:hypothetical protein
LIRDFDREMALAEVFVDRNDPIEAAYHRAMAYAIHNTPRDLEMMIGWDELGTRILTELWLR